MTRTDNAPDLARRYDFLEVPENSLVRREDGSLLVTVTAAHTGVQPYRRPDGSIRRELVNLDAVKATADGIGMRPLTLDHPPEFVTPDNSGQYSVGATGSKSQLVVDEETQGGHCTTSIAITRRDAIEAFDRGMRGVSCGYQLLDLVETPGVYQGEPYDAIQVRAKAVNHLAMCENPRATGAFMHTDSAWLRADSNDAAQAPPKTAGKPRTDKGQTMNPLLIALLGALGVARTDSEDADLTKAHLAVDKLRADHAAEKLRADQMEEEAEKEDQPDLAEENKILKAKIAELESEKADRDAADKARADSAALEALKPTAERLKVTHDGKGLRDLRLAILRTRFDSSVVPDDAPDATLAAMCTVLASEQPASQDPSRYDHGKGNARNDTAGSGRRVDTADADDDYNDPTLARIDANYTARVAGRGA